MIKYHVQCNYCGHIWVEVALGDHLDIEPCDHCGERNDFKATKLINTYEKE